MISIHLSTIISSCLLVFAFHISNAQNSEAMEFKGESKIIQVMLSDSMTIFGNDTLTIELSYNTNGSLQKKHVYYHPDGAPDERWKYEYLNFAESSYDENGIIASYIEWLNGKHHGNYMTFDSEKFVTHWVFNNGILADVKNDNCRFLNHKGTIITKEEFIKICESPEFGQWGYYLFESESEPYSMLKCVDYVMYSEKRPIPGPLDIRYALKLIKRLNKTCKEKK